MSERGRWWVLVTVACLAAWALGIWLLFDA